MKAVTFVNASRLESFLMNRARFAVIAEGFVWIRFDLFVSYNTNREVCRVPLFLSPQSANEFLYTACLLPVISGTRYTEA